MDRSLQYNNGMWSVPNLRPTRAQTAASAYRGRRELASNSMGPGSSYGSAAGKQPRSSGRPRTTGRRRAGRYVSRESLRSEEPGLGGGGGGGCPQLRPLGSSVSTSPLRRPLRSPHRGDGDEAGLVTAEWSELKDEKSGLTYYENRVTGETSW